MESIIIKTETQIYETCANVSQALLLLLPTLTIPLWTHPMIKNFYYCISKDDTIQLRFLGLYQHKSWTDSILIPMMCPIMCSWWCHHTSDNTELILPKLPRCWSVREIHAKAVWHLPSSYLHSTTPKSPLSPHMTPPQLERFLNRCRPNLFFIIICLVQIHKCNSVTIH